MESESQSESLLGTIPDSEESTQGQPSETLENTDVTQSSYKLASQEPLSTVLDISVSESERRSSSTININEYYTVYLIETRLIAAADADADAPTLPDGVRLAKQGALWRRYSDFETLAGYLGETYPFVVTPPLPEKRASHVWQKLAADPLDPEFIDRRRVGLESFLLRVASHPILSWDPMFRRFVQEEKDWKDILTGTGYLEKVERQLKTLNASIRVKKGDSRFEELLSYGKELETHVSALLRSRARLTDATQAIRREHASYGRVLSQWSALEPQMGDALQRAGHYMDAHAASIDQFVEEEEMYMDQLKEYLHYAAALQALCHKYTNQQYQLERLDDGLAALSQKREAALQGKMGLWRFFVSVDTDEVREVKVAEIDQQIADTERQIQLHSAQLADFVEKALADAERFHARKVKDLRETLVNYMKLQVRICKKGLQTWKHFRQCVDSIGEPNSSSPAQNDVIPAT